MEFKLKDIEGNPFRAIERYPIQKSKVDALVESINETGFWDNIVARKVEGKAQIAYGHHRLAAMRQVFSANREINLIIRPLTDEQMIHIMARENMEEWGTSAVIEQETVRTVVEAYAAGKVELKQPAKNSSHIRYAPSFVINQVPAPERRLPYTAESLSEFLGWGVDKVQDTLNAIDAFMERFAQKLREFFKQEEWTEIMLHRKHASTNARNKLAQAIEQLIDEGRKNVDKLRSTKERRVKHKHQPSVKLLAMAPDCA